MSDVMDERQAWVERVLGFHIGASQPDEGPLRTRLSKLEPAYLRVMRLDPPERTKLSALMASSIENLDSGALDKAAQALNRLEQLLGADGGAAKPVMQTTTIQVADLVRDPAQLVAYRKVLLQWEGARKQARAQLDGLKSTIAGKAPDLAAAAAVLDRVLDRLNDDLSNAIDDAIGAADDRKRTSLHERAAALARDYLVRVNFDPVFRCIDQNEIAPLTLRAVLGGALKDLVAALPA